MKNVLQGIIMASFRRLLVGRDRNFYKEYE